MQQRHTTPVKEGLLLGYARVSRGDEQTNTLQAKALRAAGCRRIFEETASGGRWDRPQLHRMLDHLREGDTVVVWKLDRLSRSLKDVLHIMERISASGGGFRSLTENIDTTTAAGRMMMQMVGSFAEFERAMIRERTSAGLAAAWAEGRVGGRRRKLDAAKRREIAELARIVQGTVCKILAAHDVKPHKVRYYLEHRDDAFEAKMAEVLCAYREVAFLKETGAAGTDVAVISYDEKPGIQALGATAPDLPPKPSAHSAFARDHEYQHHGTLSLLAGIDLLTGHVHARVEDQHHSREFIGFLKQLDAADPAQTAIKLILDNHSAHISKETKAWAAAQPKGRFCFVFTPKHGSWLNLIEGFFSKMARSVLRHIRVASKAELKQRILAYLNDLNRDPVVHTWTYKLAKAA